MFKRISFLCFSVVILSANICLAQDVIDEFPKGSINWSKGIVTAIGSGVPPSGAGNMAQARLLAERAAISDARRNLLEIVGEVRVDAVSTVGTLMAKRDIVVTKVNGIVKGSIVTERRYLDDGSIEVTVEMPITGAFLNVMFSEVRSVPSVTMPLPVPKPKKKDLPKIEVKVPTIPPAPPEPPVPAVPSEPVKEAKVTPEPEKLDLTKVNYSGLIIDAREIDVKPALMPKVLDEKGSVIYSSANMQKEDAVKTGVVGYAKEVDAAKKHPRVTETPIVIAALKGSGGNRSDVVISDRDSGIITTTEPALGYLKKGRVMIVYR
ncbi:MAG: hypothetical protein Q7T53_12490 [Deltaproteobacteria bacterium]|nr:hypothetical protein [Deltaproteobacteria bacterium]